MLLFLKREEDGKVDLKVIQHYIILSKGFTASGSKAISFVGNVMQSEIISNIQEIKARKGKLGFLAMILL